MTSFTCETETTTIFPKITDKVTGKQRSIRVRHRTLYLTSETGERVSGVKRYKITVTVRGGVPRFSVHYIPAPKQENWWTPAVESDPDDWKRELEPNGKPSSYDSAGIQQWLKYRVQDVTTAIYKLLYE